MGLSESEELGCLSDAPTPDRRLERWGKGQECSSWGFGHPSLDAVCKAAQNNGAVGGLLRGPGVEPGSPSCEWPLILNEEWELRVLLYPSWKTPLGDSHPGRGREA